MELFKLLCFI
ncbi:transposase IS200 like family protein, partial [Vibrio parahaemolyticus 50]